MATREIPEILLASTEDADKLELEIAESLAEVFQDGVEWACHQVLTLLRAEAGIGGGGCGCNGS